MKRGLMVVAVTLVMVILYAVTARAEKIGEVDTSFVLTGPNHKIIVEAFDDPSIPGVTCHVSYPSKGGIMGALGLAEERSETSIACRQIGPITLPPNLKEKEDVFSKSRSALFKKMHVVRMVDRRRNVLVYLVMTDKLVDGSPKHSLSTVPVMRWR